MNSNYNAKTKAIIYSLVSTILINSFIMSIKKINYTTQDYGYEYLQEYTLDDLKELIYSSSFLSEEEKDYLYNQDFLEDILPLINTSVADRIRYQRHFNEITINSYDDDDSNKDYSGYYTPFHPSSIFVKNYDELESRRDTVAHEFIHLCQNNTTYNVITEASAEIISYEYFEGAKLSAYPEQVRLLRNIMEIIGPEPIWNYNFTGDFSPIEAEIKPYLSETEYKEFLSSLSFDQRKPEEKFQKFKRLDELIAIIYKNKYNRDISDDEIINAIEKNSYTLSRYYFNKRYMDKEHNYYIDKTKKDFSILSYQEAIDQYLFMAYAVKYDEISYEEAMSIISKQEANVRRKIDFSTHNIIINREVDVGYHEYISGIIDGITYTMADVDELANQGIIDVTYYSIYFKQLNADEYFNDIFLEGAQKYVMYSQKDLTLFDDHIEGFIPRKVYLEPISEKNFSRLLNK